MSHAIHRVDQFSIVGPYTLSVRFNDGTTQRIDVRPVLEGQLFGPLENLAVFNAVAPDPCSGSPARTSDGFVSASRRHQRLLPKPKAAAEGRLTTRCTRPVPVAS